MVVLDGSRTCDDAACPICRGACAWCAAPLPPLDPADLDGVVAEFGRLCAACAARQDRAREGTG